MDAQFSRDQSFIVKANLIQAFSRKIADFKGLFQDTDILHSQ